MKNLLFLFVITMGAGSMSFASVSSEPTDTLPGWADNIEFSGSVDAYWRGNMNSEYGVAPPTSFADDPGFAIGMANLVGSYDAGAVGFVADLVFGPRGEDAVFLSEGSPNIVNQLYVDWDISESVTATFGNFNTFLGYEVISPAANFNYSTSYMFSYGPFSHTGLKFDFDLGSGFSAMAAVMNPTDYTEANNQEGEMESHYTAGAQLGYGFDGGSVYLNAIFADDFYQLDLTGGVDLTDDFYLGVNATTAEDSFGGAAGYLQYSFSDVTSIGARVEYFDDKNTVFGLIDENVFDATLSSNIEIGDLTLIPEFRMDMLSFEGFPEDGGTTDNLTSFLLAAVYGF